MLCAPGPAAVQMQPPYSCTNTTAQNRCCSADRATAPSPHPRTARRQAVAQRHQGGVADGLWVDEAGCHHGVEDERQQGHPERHLPRLKHVPAPRHRLLVVRQVDAPAGSKRVAEVIRLAMHKEDMRHGGPDVFTGGGWQQRRRQHSRFPPPQEAGLHFTLLPQVLLPIQVGIVDCTAICCRRLPAGRGRRCVAVAAARCWCRYRLSPAAGRRRVHSGPVVGAPGSQKRWWAFERAGQRLLGSPHLLRVSTMDRRDCCNWRRGQGCALAAVNSCERS